MMEQVLSGAQLPTLTTEEFQESILEILVGTLTEDKNILQNPLILFDNNLKVNRCQIGINLKVSKMTEPVLSGVLLLKLNGV